MPLTIAVTCFGLGDNADAHHQYHVIRRMYDITTQIKTMSYAR